MNQPPVPAPPVVGFPSARLNPSQVLDGFRDAYGRLEHAVQRAINIDVGDPARLCDTRTKVLDFLGSVERVR